ncbi:major facilitator superfamily protein [Clostridium puniceum]|uniref:Major facilitator superfamily protein n=1 Tax=Clostridium puniceum TaxID=29367 RepID=A0A1S8TEI5_9CLOT|nr:MFS transporter [Clostridium puniceum]OOM76049.1 major facilitator superfamily protein [Clostridium puniceum]
MKNQGFQKTPFARLLIGAVLGLGTSIAPLVLLGFGLATFNIIRIVGVENATAVYGMVGGITGIFLVISSPLGGAIADKTKFKMGRRRFWMFAGSVGGALSMLTFTYATSIPVLIIGYCLANLFYGMVTLSCYAVVPEQVDPEKFGRVSGLFGAAAPVCVMIGQALLGVYADVPVQQKLLAIILIQVIGGILAALLIKDTQFTGNVKKKKGFSEGFKNFYPSVKKYPEYTWALLTKLFINVTNAGLNMLTLFYIMRFHLGEGDIMRVMAYQSPAIMLMVVAGIFGGFISDKIKKQKPFVMIAALITGICMIAFAFSGSVSFVIIGNFFFNFGFGMYTAIDNALVNRILPSKENTGKDIAIMNTTTQLSSAVVQFLAPMLITLGTKLLSDDGYTFFFIVLSGFSILSALVVIPIPEVGQSKNEKTLGKEELVNE